MGKLLGYISSRDKRIADELLAEYLPGQRSLVQYVSRAIRQSRGTLFTARQIGTLLAEEMPARAVTWHDTKRLGVHHLQEQMNVVKRDLKRIRPKAMDKRALLYARLMYRRSDIAKAKTFEELGASNPPIPPGSNIDPMDVMTHCSIYLCALAMLAGVKTDPWKIEGQSFSG